MVFIGTAKFSLALRDSHYWSIVSFSFPRIQPVLTAHTVFYGHLRDLKSFKLPYFSPLLTRFPDPYGLLVAPLSELLCHYTLLSGPILFPSPLSGFHHLLLVLISLYLSYPSSPKLSLFLGCSLPFCYLFTVLTRSCWLSLARFRS